MASGFPAPQLAVIPSNGILTNPSLTQSFGGVVVNLAVVVDGSSSAPFPITVR